MMNKEHVLNISFYEKKDIDKKLLNKVNIFYNIFFDEDPDILDFTTICLLEKNNNIIGLTCIISPTKNDMKKYSTSIKIKNYLKNIKEQGVTSDDSYIYNFCIDEKERKKGYASYLLNECHIFLKKMNKRKCFLFVKNKNIPAICLYNKFKYRVHRSTPDGFIMNINFINNNIN